MGVHETFSSIQLFNLFDVTVALLRINVCTDEVIKGGVFEHTTELFNNDEWLDWMLFRFQFRLEIDVQIAGVIQNWVFVLAFAFGFYAHFSVRVVDNSKIVHFN